ncbi:6580_t:CDS:10, partial [Cetraspora pellucida]
KNDFKKTHDLTNHLNRKFKCKQTQIPNLVYPPNPNIFRSQSPASNSPSSLVYVHEKKRSKRGQTMHLSIEDLFDLIEESSSKWQKKTKVSQPIEEDSKAEFGLTTQSEKDPKDLNKKVPWPVSFPDKEWHREVWQKGIQTAKDMFKVDGAEYAFSTWFAEIESKKYEAGITKEQAQEILNAIDNGEFLIRVKFIRNDSVYRDKSQTKITFKIIDKYEPIRESKKAGRKYIRGGPNVIFTKKTKPGFWIEIDEKFLIREVSEQSEVERLDTNTHFDQAKRGHGLTKIHRQKINDWEKKMRISDARGDTWEAISNALRGPQAIWLMGVGDTSQTISQFVLEDGCIFRTWKKHTEIIETCKQLVNDTIDWQYQERIINKEKKSIFSESLKVVDLAEQVFGTNHAGSRLANEINEWHSISGKVNENIRQACVKHGHGQGECTPWFNRFGHLTHYLVRVAVNGKLPEDDITGFAQYRKHFAYQSGEGCGKEKEWAPIVLLRYLLEVGILESVTIREAIISLTKQTKVWLPRNRDISCAIIGKFTQGDKIDKKHLIHRLVTDEGKLDFLIKDCTDIETFAGREKCPLGFILTYYEGHQPQYIYLQTSMLAYAHINLLEMLWRFDPNEVVRIATDSIYVRKEALYKIENISAFFEQVEVKSDPNLCSHYPSCAMCTDPKELFISKSEYAKWIKEFLKTKRPLVKYDCKRHKPFVCRFCFGEWFYKPDSYALSHQPEKQEIREIQPSQWCNKGKKIYGPVSDIVYWPKNRHWESIKNIPESTAPSIHDPITRCWKLYLNGGGGLGKTTCAIQIFKNINMVVICCDDDAQPSPFFRKMPHNWLKEHADYYEEVLTDYHAKCSKLCELKKAMRRQNNRIQSKLFREILPTIEKWEQLHQIKYPEIPIPLIYRPRVKNDIVYLSLNTLPDKFLKDMLADKKVIDWELEYAMTIHTIGRMEYLNQLIQVEAPPLPPEIA